MRLRFLAGAALAAAAVAGVAALTASAAGPAPPLVIGEPGIPVAGGAHVVTIAGPSASSTRLWLVRDRDGTTSRKRVLPGKRGGPGVTCNGAVRSRSMPCRRTDGGCTCSSSRRA